MGVDQRSICMGVDLREVAFAWELPLGCLQGGLFPLRGVGRGQRQRCLRVQEYLAHKKPPPPLCPPCDPRHRPTVGSYRGWGSYERGTPVLTSGHPEIGEIREAAGAEDGGR